jgi:hypothetical protein
VVCLSGGVLEGGPDILCLEVRKVFEDLRFAGARGKHFEHVLNPNAHPANAWATATLVGTECNAIQIIHGGRVRFFKGKGKSRRG